MNARMGAPLVWLSAAELSGDMHAAHLVRALSLAAPNFGMQGLSFAGMGGPHLREISSFEALFRVEELSVMGFSEVLGRLPHIFSLLRRIKAAMAARKPAALLCVDAPSFNFRVIKIARSLGIPVYYYISPKAWAWGRGRVRFLQRNVRRLISILPFEVDFYRQFGMDIDYVGNPLVDMMDWPRLDGIHPVPGAIGLLPGSRAREINSLLPEFGKAARILLTARPDLRFTCIRAPGFEETTLRALWPDDVPVRFLAPEDRYALMKSAEMLIAASGTATLEAALLGTPTLAVYKVSPVTYALGRLVVRIPYISLSNLILGKELFPELLQEKAAGESIARYALAWLKPSPGGGSPLEAVRHELAALKGILGGGGATGKAARVILEDLQTVLQG